MSRSSSHHRPKSIFVAMLGVLVLAACSPAAPALTPIQIAATITPTVRATAVPPTLAPTALGTSAPQSLAASEVNIVEPPFKPPQEWKFAPNAISVKLGTHITWTNTGAVLHTVTADDNQTFDSGNLEPKATFSFTPTAPGTLAYHCNLHPWMKATITVLP